MDGIWVVGWSGLFCLVVVVPPIILFALAPRSKRRLRELLDAAYLVVVGEVNPRTFAEFQRRLCELNQDQQAAWDSVNQFIEAYDPVARRERRLRGMLGVASVCSDFPVLVGILGTLLAVSASSSASNILENLALAVDTTIAGIVATMVLKAVFEWKEPVLSSIADEMQQVTSELDRWQRGRAAHKHDCPSN